MAREHQEGFVEAKRFGHRIKLCHSTAIQNRFPKRSRLPEIDGIETNRFIAEYRNPDVSWIRNQLPEIRNCQEVSENDEFGVSGVHNCSRQRVAQAEVERRERNEINRTQRDKIQ